MILHAPQQNHFNQSFQSRCSFYGFSSTKLSEKTPSLFQPRNPWITEGPFAGTAACATPDAWSGWKGWQRCIRSLPRRTRWGGTPVGTIKSSQRWGDFLGTWRVAGCVCFVGCFMWIGFEDEVESGDEGRNWKDSLWECFADRSLRVERV